jgi:pimeloyl-ACP methyl ester carboxylesterase
MSSSDIGELTVKANGISFSCLAAGPEDGRLALCLHGFPDSARTWRYLLPALASRGFRAVAPWMRGYAPTDVAPDGLYQTGALAVDAGALHEALGGDERAVLIGHDWGALTAYGAASLGPDRWSRVVTLAVPPTAALATSFFSYDQLHRSWYMFFFQNPLAEAAVSMNDLEFIARLWADWSPGYDATEDLGYVRAALGEAANLEAALGYYRAQFDPARQSPELASEQIATTTVPIQPTLYLHGADDGCMGADLVPPTANLLSEGSQAVVVPGTGHFLHLERPHEINQRIVDFVNTPQA